MPVETEQKPIAFEAEFAEAQKLRLLEGLIPDGFKSSYSGKTRRWTIKTRVKGQARRCELEGSTAALESECDRLADLPPEQCTPDHWLLFDGCMEALNRQSKRERLASVGKHLPRGKQAGREPIMGETRFRAAWAYRLIWRELGKPKTRRNAAVVSLIRRAGTAKLRRERLKGESERVPYWSRRVERTVHLVAFLLSEELRRDKDLSDRWQKAKLEHLPLRSDRALKVKNFFQTYISPTLTVIDRTIERHPAMMDPRRNAYLRTLFGNV